MNKLTNDLISQFDRVVLSFSIIEPPFVIFNVFHIVHSRAVIFRVEIKQIVDISYK